MENSTRMIIIIGFSILMITILGICCMGVQACPTEPDAVITLSNYTPPEIYLRPMEIETVEMTPRENLTRFLAKDTTDEKEWNLTIDYVCMDFAIDLGKNLTDAGFDAGCVFIASKYHNVGMWHSINWVKIGNETIYIEPQDDNTFDPDEYKEMINDSIHVFREIPVSSAMRNRADSRSWR